MSIVSYAQNFEDVMLWRALGHVQTGFYIDIGAQHPVIDSVSKAFYEKGWRGIHVEATPAYANLLRQDRPDETVIQAGVNDAPGTITFYEIPETGLSTGDADIAQSHRARDFTVQEITVPCVTLLDVFKQARSKEIHWLKIDVEGMELQVLRSWGKSKARPWMVVIESTLPLTQTENHQRWESCLLDRGYAHVYFDGLNRYYLSPDHPELAAAFRSGPNVFDGFTLDGTASSPFCVYVNEKHRQTQQALQQQLAQVHQEQIGAKQGLDAALAEISSQLQAAQEEALKTKANLAEEAVKHVALERALLAEIQTLQAQSRQAEQEAAQREQALRELASETYRQAQTQAQAHLHNLAQREQAFGQQLQELQTQMREAQAEASQRERVLQVQSAEALQQAQTHLHTLAQREQVFGQQLQELQTQMREAQAEASQRERALRAQSVEALQQAQTQAQAHLNTLAQRERAFGQQLQELQTQMREVQAEASQHERVLQVQSAEALQQAQTQAHAHLHTLAQREQAFGQQLQELQMQMRHADQAAAQREQALRELASETYRQAQAQAQTHLRTQAQHEKVLSQEIAALQSEAQALHHARQLQVQQHAAELSTRLNEHNRLIEAGAALEAQLKAEILFEQQTSLRLHQSLADVQQHLATTQTSLTWRMTAPLRTLASFIGAKKKLASPSPIEGGATDNLMAAVAAPRSINVPEALVEPNTPAHAMEEGVRTDAIVPPVSESPSINVQHVPIEPTMPHSAPAINLPAPAIASTLNELLAWHDQHFIQCAYQTLLGRAPDPEGLGYYLGRLRTGFSKIQILAQLRLSKEGKAHVTVQLPGLDVAIQRHQQGQYPLIGWLFRRRNGGEGNDPIERKLRAIENQLGFLNAESSRCFNQMEAALADLHHLVVQQTPSVVAALDASMATPGATSIAAIQQQEPDGLKQLSPRAKDVYFQLKTAAANQAVRVA